MFCCTPINANGDSHRNPPLARRRDTSKRTRVTVCLFGRSRRSTLVTVSPLGLGNSPPLAFATQLMRGSQSQAGSPLEQHHWKADSSGVVHHTAIHVEYTGTG